MSVNKPKMRICTTTLAVPRQSSSRLYKSCNCFWKIILGWITRLCYLPRNKKIPPNFHCFSGSTASLKEVLVTWMSNKAKLMLSTKIMHNPTCT